MVIITIPLPYMRASFCEISGLSLQKNSYIKINSDRLTRKTDYIIQVHTGKKLEVFLIKMAKLSEQQHH